VLLILDLVFSLLILVRRDLSIYNYKHEHLNVILVYSLAKEQSIFNINNFYSSDTSVFS
jgi:hypothetical protein